MLKEFFEKNKDLDGAFGYLEWYASFEVYELLTRKLENSSFKVESCKDYQKKYNSFYGTGRRSKPWRDCYFKLMDEYRYDSELNIRKC